MDYAEALAEIVPQMQADGADLILVPSHVCVNELVDLINQTAALGWWRTNSWRYLPLITMT